MNTDHTPPPTTDTDQNITGDVRLRDIVWGGRIRQAYQGQIWNIAWEAAVNVKRTYHGGMLSSRETISLDFLDGGVWDSRGYFDSTCGMFWSGKLAKAYILSSLGLDARKLLGLKKLPALEELQEMLDKQHREAQQAGK